MIKDEIVEKFVHCALEWTNESFSLLEGHENS